MAALCLKPGIGGSLRHARLLKPGGKAALGEKHAKGIAADGGCHNQKNG
jgi:hypothetical protein